MPRITRKQQKVFAVNATNNGVFGSLQANDPVHSQDPDLIQGRTAYSNGWNDATYSAEKLPPLEEFQALQYLFSRQLAYIMQDGIPEWDTNTTYYKGALVKAIQSDGSFILYASLVDNNQGNLVTDTTKWVITNTSTNFHQGIPNWRNDVIYSAGDWVKAQNGNNWAIFESLQNNNLNNAITDSDYWTIKPFTSSLVLFTPQWFDYEIEDVSWLRADTFSWQDGTVYSDAYNHLVEDWDNYWTGKDPTVPSNWENETIGSYLITYITAPDGHKIVYPNQETIVQNIYNESGVAWYYILDKENQRFKLPRTKFGFTGLRDAVEKYVPAGLPNITGQFNAGGHDRNPNTSGPFYVISNRNEGNSGNDNFAVLFGFNASRSSSIYGNSTTVQPPATQMYLYFYVGQFSQTATEQTAGLNSELFNGKVDLNAANLSTSGKSLISGLGMPNDLKITPITLGASGAAYTAPANGYFYGTNDSSEGRVSFTGNGLGISSVGALQFPARAFVPCKRGGAVYFHYAQPSGSTTYLYFIYAVGEQ